MGLMRAAGHTHRTAAVAGARAARAGTRRCVEGRTGIGFAGAGIARSIGRWGRRRKVRVAGRSRIAVEGRGSGLGVVVGRRGLAVGSRRRIRRRGRTWFVVVSVCLVWGCVVARAG